MIYESSFFYLEYLRKKLPMTSSLNQITVFKSLTNLIIVAGDFFWHKQPVSALILLSLIFMTVGALFAAWNDIEFR